MGDNTVVRIKTQAGSLLGSETRTPAGNWERRELLITDIPAGTTALEIELELDNIGGGASPDVYIGNTDLRIGKFSSELLSDGDFEAADYASMAWTEDVGTWRLIQGLENPIQGLNELAGDQSAIGPASAAAGTISQSVSLPGGFGPGDFAWLSWWQAQGVADDDTGQVTLQFLNSGGSLISESTLGPETMTIADVWEQRVLYPQIPDGCTDMKVVIDVVRDGGFGDIDVAFDEVSLRCIRRRVRHPLTGADVAAKARIGIDEASRDLFESYWRLNQDATDDAPDLESAGNDLSPVNTPAGESYTAVIDARCHKFGDSANDDTHFIAASNSVLDAGTGSVLLTGHLAVNDPDGHVLGKFTSDTGYKVEFNSGVLEVRFGDGSNVDLLTVGGFVANDPCQFWALFDRDAGTCVLWTNKGASQTIPITATLTLDNSDTLTIGSSGGAATDSADFDAESFGIGFGTDVEGLTRDHFETMRKNVFIDQLPEAIMPPVQAPPQPVRLSAALRGRLSGGTGPLE